jgi:hypothetical protein
MECQYLLTCGFFKKHSISESVVCQGLIDKYCKGTEMKACKRREYQITYGNPPDDDMMPSGLMIKGKS